MEKKMETTRDYIGVIQRLQGYIRGYIGKMEKKMETIIMC